MAVVNKFNVNKQQATLNMSANGVSYNSSLQYDENTVGNKLSELAKEVDIASFFINGAITKSGSFRLTTAAKRTDFIKVKDGIKIKAYDGATSYPQYAAVAFYNADLEFISTMEFSTAGVKEIVLTSFNIPSNAEYFIASTINDYLNISYVKFTDSNISIISDDNVNMKLNGVKDNSLSLFTKYSRERCWVFSPVV